MWSSLFRVKVAALLIFSSATMSMLKATQSGVQYRFPLPLHRHSRSLSSWHLQHIHSIGSIHSIKGRILLADQASVAELCFWRWQSSSAHPRRREGRTRQAQDYGGIKHFPERR